MSPVPGYAISVLAAQRQADLRAPADRRGLSHQLTDPKSTLML